jgi:hypothetical protein
MAEIEYRTKSAQGKVCHPFFKGPASKGLREDLRSRATLALIGWDMCPSAWALGRIGVRRVLSTDTLSVSGDSVSAASGPGLFKIAVELQ